MDWIVTTILISTLIIVYIYWYTKRKTNYWQRRGFPHLKSLTSWGNKTQLEIILGLLSANEANQRVYQQLKNERFVGIMQANNPYLLVQDPELVNKILINDFGNFHDRGLFFDEKLDPLEASTFNLTGKRIIC